MVEASVFWLLISGFLSSGFLMLARPGGDRLSRALRRSTIGAEGFHGRVRDGIGCWPLAIATRPHRDRRSETRRSEARTVLASGFWFLASVFTRSGRLSLQASGFLRAKAERRRSSMIERLVPVGTSVAALAPPAYRRGGLPRLLDETWFRGGLPA